MYAKHSALMVVGKRAMFAFICILVGYSLAKTYILREPKRESHQNSNVASNTDAIIKTRNTLSKQLNDMRRIIGQMQCQQSKKKTSERGGYCNETSSAHNTDKTLLPLLSQFLQNKQVASFGDGRGAYKREILKLGQVRSYAAFDGAPYCVETSEGHVQFMDLSIPQYGIPIYDWIISLEVAEHIDEQFEAIYLDNIFRHAREGIILSWAVPGQGGVEHVNNKPLSYVVSVMEKNGFEWDEKSSENLRSAATFSWLRRNINVYIRKHYANFLTESNLLKYFYKEYIQTFTYTVF